MEYSYLHSNQAKKHGSGTKNLIYSGISNKLLNSSNSLNRSSSKEPQSKYLLILNQQKKNKSTEKYAFSQTAKFPPQQDKPRQQSYYASEVPESKPVQFEDIQKSHFQQLLAEKQKSIDQLRIQNISFQSSNQVLSKQLNEARSIMQRMYKDSNFDYQAYQLFEQLDAQCQQFEHCVQARLRDLEGRIQEIKIYRPKEQLDSMRRISKNEMLNNQKMRMLQLEEDNHKLSATLNDLSKELGLPAKANLLEEVKRLSQERHSHALLLAEFQKIFQVQVHNTQELPLKIQEQIKKILKQKEDQILELTNQKLSMEQLVKKVYEYSTRDDLEWSRRLGEGNQSLSMLDEAVFLLSGKLRKQETQQHQVHDLQEQLAQFEKIMADMEREIAANSSQKAQKAFESKILKMYGLIESIENYNDQLSRFEDKLCQQQSKVDLLKLSIQEQITNQSESQQIIIRQQAQTIEDMQTHQIDLERQLGTLALTNSHFQRDAHSLQQQIASLNGRNQHLDQTNTTLTLEVENLQASNHKLERENHQLQENITNLTEQLSSKLQDAQEIKQLNHYIEQQEQQLSIYANEKKHLESQLNQLKQLERTQEQMQVQFEQDQQTIRSLEQSKKQLNEELIQIKKEYQQLENTVEQKNSQWQEFERQEKEKEESLEKQLREQLEEQQQKMEELREKNESLAKEVKDQGYELWNLRSDNQYLNEQIVSLKGQAQQSIQSVTYEYTEKINMMMSQQREEMRKVRQNCEKQVREQASKVEECRAEVKRLEQSVLDAQEEKALEVEQKQREIHQLRERVQVLEIQAKGQGEEEGEPELNKLSESQQMAQFEDFPNFGEESSNQTENSDVEQIEDMIRQSERKKQSQN